jgi:hypothetical protein
MGALPRLMGHKLTGVVSEQQAGGKPRFLTLKLIVVVDCQAAASPLAKPPF